MCKYLNYVIEAIGEVRSERCIIWRIRIVGSSGQREVNSNFLNLTGEE